MSDHIPIEIQIEIIKRLPVESVIRFACVSKQWKSLIHSSKFVNDYSLHTQQQKQQRLIFVAKRDARKPYLLFADHDSFPQNKSDVLSVPKSVNYSKVVGSSHGLFCLLGSSLKNTTDMVVVIWNPMIRKSVSIGVPTVVYNPYYDHPLIFGFGVCPNTGDPKIVKINQKGPVDPEKLEDISCTNWQVEVYTLSSGVWRSPSGNLPHKWLDFFGTNNDQVVIDGSIYWIVNERISLKDSIETLISFNLTSEEFSQIYLPDKLLYGQNDGFKLIFKLRESLAIFERKPEPVYNVWIMENGASKSFTQLFTINENYRLDNKQPVVWSNSQLTMIDIRKGLVVYEPCSKRFNNLGIYGDPDSLYVSSYTESLLLLDHTLTVGGGHFKENFVWIGKISSLVVFLRTFLKTFVKVGRMILTTPVFAKSSKIGLFNTGLTSRGSFYGMSAG